MPSVALHILCPLEIERQAVAAATVQFGDRVNVECIGPGAASVHVAVESLPDDNMPVLLAGFAGGLRDGVTPRSDLDIDRVVTPDRSHVWVPPIVGPLSSFESEIPACIVGSDDVVSTPADKRALAARTGGDLVDMESHAFAEACNHAGRLWGIVRAVSDPVDQALPQDVAKWIDEDGQLKLARAVVGVARRPWLVPALMKHSAAAKETLSDRIKEAAFWLASEPVIASDAGSILDIRLPNVETILVCGGSFDPVHRAHVALANAARASLGRNTWLLIVPAHRSPHKKNGPQAPNAARLTMLRRAFGAADGRSFASIWTDEMDRAERDPEQPSYMIDTIERLRALKPGPNIRLLIGADQAASFHRWHRAEELFNAAQPLVMLREPQDDPEAFRNAIEAAGAWDDAEVERWMSSVLPVETIDVSSTQVRDVLKRGEYEQAKELIDERVLEYIRGRNLYR